MVNKMYKVEMIWRIINNKHKYYTSTYKVTNKTCPFSYLNILKTIFKTYKSTFAHNKL